MIDFDEIRKTVAIKHNVLLDKDDLMLVTLTINELVFKHYVAILVEQNKELLKALESAQKQGIEESKEIGSRVINQATAHVSDHVRAAVKAEMDSGIERMKALEKKKEDVKSQPDYLTSGLGLMLGALIVGLVFLYIIRV